MQKSYALDTSALIVHYYKRNLKEIIKESYVNLHTLSETFYIICRTEGLEKAAHYIQEIVGTATIVPSHELALTAGQFKCKYRISLADAWTLATAKIKRVPALFGIREREILDILDQLKKEVEVEFL